MYCCTTRGTEETTSVTNKMVDNGVCVCYTPSNASRASRDLHAHIYVSEILFFRESYE